MRPARWLPARRPAGESGPVRFWLSDLPSGMALATLVRPAKLRWRIEDYREMKQALGSAHFEDRTWNGWHHHVVLFSAAHRPKPSWLAQWPVSAQPPQLVSRAADPRLLCIQRDVRRNGQGVSWLGRPARLKWSTSG